LDVASDGEISTLTAHGVIDVSTSSALQRALDAVLDHVPGPQIVRVDLTDVQFMDTLGVAVLLTARNRTERSGRRLVVVSTSPALDRLFAITGLDRLLRETASPTPPSSESA
jgi:anti-sigma B factor antagonist